MVYQFSERQLIWCDGKLICISSLLAYHKILPICEKVMCYCTPHWQWSSKRTMITEPKKAVWTETLRVWIHKRLREPLLTGRISKAQTVFEKSEVPRLLNPLGFPAYYFTKSPIISVAGQYSTVLRLLHAGHGPYEEGLLIWCQQMNARCCNTPR